MVAQRLGHAAETLTAHRDDRLAKVGRGLFGDRFDVVADQADGTLGLDGDALVEGKQLIDFLDQLGELLVAAENDVLFLEVRGEVHRGKGVHAGRADIVIAASGTGILATADGAVRNMDHVLDRPPDDAAGTGVGTAADGHHAGQRLAVGRDALLGLFNRLVIDRKMLAAVFLGLFRINLKNLGDQGFGFFAR